MSVSQQRLFQESSGDGDLHEAPEQQLIALVEAAGVLLTSVSMSQALDATVDLARRFIAADAYAVWLFQEKSWRVRASFGLATNDKASSSSNFPDAVSALQDESIRSSLATPMPSHGPAIGSLVLYWRYNHHASDRDIRISTVLGTLASAAIANAALLEKQNLIRQQAELTQRRSSLLADVSAVLASSLDYKSTLRDMAQLAASGFSDWCAVDIIGQNTLPERLTLAHAEPADLKHMDALLDFCPCENGDKSRLLHAVRTGPPELHEEIIDDVLVQSARDEFHLEELRAAGLQSAICVPVLARGRVLGSLTFLTAGTSRRFSTEDLKFAEDLARRTAIAIDHAQLFQSAHRERADAEASAFALRQSNLDLQEFAFIASHDLKEPLRTIASHTQLLARRYKGRLDAEADEIIQFVVDATLRMSDLLGGLLDYSRIARDRELPSHQVDVDGAMNWALMNLQIAIQETHATVTRGPLPRVIGDSAQLAQVFQILIDNAVKYRGPDPPRIHISAEKQARHWVFSCRDNGIGIDPIYHEKIFGIFKRLHGREVPGTGMGLAICRRIAERHGGRVWVKSEEGKGADFCFSIATD